MLHAASGGLHDRARRQAFWLGCATLGMIGAVSLWTPFLRAPGWSVLSFAGLGISLYPLIVPPTVTALAAYGLRWVLLGS